MHLLRALCVLCVSAVLPGFRLFADPGVVRALPVEEFFRLEPEGDLLLGGLDGVGAVADVAADVLGEEEGLVNMFLW